MVVTDRPGTERPGFFVSGGVHVALIVVTLLSFSHAREFDAAQESVPVETLTDKQFNDIMKGEKTAKEVKPDQKAEKLAAVAETRPDPPLAEAKKDVPTPPPPLKRIADPGEAEKPEEVPTPPQRVAALPPPEPPKPVAKVEPPKPVPTPPEKPVIKEEAQAEVPKPVRRPDPPKPQPPKPVAKVEPPKPPELHKVEAKKPEFKPDQLARLLEQQKAKDAQKPAPARPKSGEESEQTHRFDAANISKLLSHEAPQRRASSGARLQQTASLGAPNASAAQMSPSLWGQLDALMQEQYKQCWSYIGTSEVPKYVPEMEVEYAPDGSLIGQPVLVNPPSDPALRSLAESAKRAILRCNPLRIPTVFQPFYEQWRGRIVRFDPQEMS